MSDFEKKHGAKIGLRFSRDLVGDVSDNAGAFTVTGKERRYVGGPLFDVEYAVESVERYPLQEWWRDDQSGDMDGVEAGAEIGLEALSGDEKSILIDVGSSSSTTANWAPYKVYYYKNKVQFIILASELAARGIFPGAVINALSFKVSNKPTRNLNNFRIRLKETEDTSVSAWHTTGLTLAHYSQSIDHSLLTVGTVYKHSFNADISEWVYQGDNLLIEVSRDDTGGTNTGGIYIRTGLSANRMVTAYQDSGYSYPFDSIPIRTTESAILETTVTVLENEYGESGTYTLTLPTSTIPDPAPRLRFTAHTPADTSITCKYACTAGGEPDTWTAVDDGDLLDIDNDTLWLRFTLATEDESKTPILEAVWLEQAEATMNTVLLTFPINSRFPNVEGQLTVACDATKGNLRGDGGAVESFEESFTPADLVLIPRPYSEEHIEAEFADYVIDLQRAMHNVIGDGPFPSATSKSEGIKGHFGDDDAEHITAQLVDYSILLRGADEIEP